MLSKSCIRLVEMACATMEDVTIKKVFLGEVLLAFESHEVDELKIINCFEQLGFEVINTPESVILERTKIAAVELIYYANNSNSLIRNSDYISERVQEPYDRISRIFSQITGTTLEKYIILLKIERAKELIYTNEMTLSEIAYMLGYSSVQYLSNQFKKITGFTVSAYRNLKNPLRTPLEQLL